MLNQQKGCMTGQVMEANSLIDKRQKTSETYSNQSTKLGNFVSSGKMFTDTPIVLQILPHGPSGYEKTCMDLMRTETTCCVSFKKKGSRSALTHGHCNIPVFLKHGKTESLHLTLVPGANYASTQAYRHQT